MTGFGTSGRGNPLTRIDNDTMGIIGLVSAVAGFFALGLLLGPLAIVAGWLAMGRRWTGARQLTALIAIVLGAIDLVLALVWLTGSGAPHGVL